MLHYTTLHHGFVFLYVYIWYVVLRFIIVYSCSNLSACITQKRRKRKKKKLNKIKIKVLLCNVRSSCTSLKRVDNLVRGRLVILYSFLSLLNDRVFSFMLLPPLRSVPFCSSFYSSVPYTAVRWRPVGYCSKFFSRVSDHKYCTSSLLVVEWIVKIFASSSHLYSLQIMKLALAKEAVGRTRLILNGNYVHYIPQYIFQIAFASIWSCEISIQFQFTLESCRKFPMRERNEKILKYKFDSRFIL